MNPSWAIALVSPRLGTGTPLIASFFSACEIASFFEPHPPVRNPAMAKVLGRILPRNTRFLDISSDDRSIMLPNYPGGRTRSIVTINRGQAGEPPFESGFPGI